MNIDDYDPQKRTLYALLEMLLVLTTWQKHKSPQDLPLLTVLSFTSKHHDLAPFNHNNTPPRYKTYLFFFSV